MKITDFRSKSRRTARALIAFFCALSICVSRPGAPPSKIGAFVSPYWVLDQNGNRTWDGPPTDGLYYWGFGSTDEIPVYGDWNGDGTTKMGVYLHGTWMLDYNGNGVWDGPNVDKLVYLGGPDYTPVVGDWNGDGKTKIGAFRNGTWLIDLNGNFAWDGPSIDKLVFFGNTDYKPVVGNWNGSVPNAAKIGAYKDGVWVLDYNGNFTWDGPGTDQLVAFGPQEASTPVVGNWNAPGGTTKIGTYLNGTWLIDYNGNFALDTDGSDRTAFFGGSGYEARVGDWNGNGKTKIAAYIGGAWLIDVNGNYIWDPGGPNDDVLTSFGGSTYQPVVGVWPLIISGHVTASGYPLVGATMNLSGSSSAGATTDSSGSYAFGVRPGGNYTVTPSEGGLAFSPFSLSWNNLSANQTADFTAVPADYPAGSGPVSIPNSFTAPDPVLTCDEISGVWDDADTFGNHITWSLTQTGNLVSGQMSYIAIRSGVDCGTVTYDVTGSYNSSSRLYSLSATINGPPYDSCNQPVRPQLTKTVTLSGRACGTGSARYDTGNTSPAGSGLLMTRRSLSSNSRREGDNPSSAASTSQLRSTAPMAAAIVTPQPRDAQGSSIWTTTSPRFTVQYSSYIPVDHIAGPLPCLMFDFNNELFANGWLSYKGDANRGTYRTTESLLVVPGAQKFGNLFARGGPTRNYQIPSSPANGFFANLSSTPTGDKWDDPYTGADEDEIAHDCHLWNAKGRLTTPQCAASE